MLSNAQLSWSNAEATLKQQKMKHPAPRAAAGWSTTAKNLQSLLSTPWYQWSHPSFFHGLIISSNLIYFPGVMVIRPSRLYWLPKKVLHKVGRRNASLSCHLCQQLGFPTLSFPQSSLVSSLSFRSLPSLFSYYFEDIFNLKAMKVRDKENFHLKSE